MSTYNKTPLSLNYEFDTTHFEKTKERSSHNFMSIDANTSEPNILDTLGDSTISPQLNRLGEYELIKSNENLSNQSHTYLGDGMFHNIQNRQIVRENGSSIQKEKNTNLSQNIQQLNELLPNLSSVLENNLSEDPQHDIKIVNVVASFNLSTKIDLQMIQKKARNSEYNPKRFPALIMRLKEPSSTANMFSSGKVLVMGCKDEKSAKLSARKFARIIVKLGFEAKLADFKIINIVSTVSLGFKISLEMMAVEHPQHIMYEPEAFSGLVFRMMKPKVTVLIYHTGKLVMIGAKTMEEMKEAVENITPLIHNFKK